MCCWWMRWGGESVGVEALQNQTGERETATNLCLINLFRVITLVDENPCIKMKSRLRVHIFEQISSDQ